MEVPDERAREVFAGRWRRRQIYFGSDDGNLYGITDKVTYGKEKWKPVPTGGAVKSSPAIARTGTIYTIYFGSD